MSELREEDLEIQVYSGMGVGGQMIYESRAYCPAVTITHKPSGATVSVSDRSQLQAKVQAVEILTGLVSGYIEIEPPREDWHNGDER